MAGFVFNETELEGAYLIDNFSLMDNRGGFVKCYEKEEFLKAGISFGLNETFVSVSEKNVIRGLHFQINSPQAKLVSVLSGRAWDVIVDLRCDSTTYKKWIGIELSVENHRAIYIPKGFAHGFVALENKTMMLYQCDGRYDKETDTGIKYNSSELNIKWPLNEEDVILSARDMQLMDLFEYEKNPMKV